MHLLIVLERSLDKCGQFRQETLVNPFEIVPIEIFMSFFLYFGITAEFIKTCRMADPDFIKCSTESVQGLFKQLITGVF